MSRKGGTRGRRKGRVKLFGSWKTEEKKRKGEGEEKQANMGGSRDGKINRNKLIGDGKKRERKKGN